MKHLELIDYDFHNVTTQVQACLILVMINDISSQTVVAPTLSLQSFTSG